MTQVPVVRNVSDTARWVAAYRAREHERPDALFHDQYARLLAGERGEQIAQTLGPKGRNEWAFIARTVAYDRYISQAIRNGADTVLNLAAGLDTRPYRMDLPSSLRWIEVDLPGIIDEKEDLLRNAIPRCKLERVRLDLSDVTARRELFARVGAASRNTLVVTEGLVAYFDDSEVAAFADDLAGPQSFRRWIVDIMSPGLLRMLQRQLKQHLHDGTAPLKFAPANGVAFFEPHGWRACEVKSSVKEAWRIKRGPLLIRLVAWLPDSDPRNPGSRPWSGFTLLERTR